MDNFILEPVLSYLKTLDWAYVITFILLCYIFVNDKMITNWWSSDSSTTVEFLLRVPRNVRVMVVGGLYALLYYNFKGYSHEHINDLFQSFIFSVAFHGLLIKKISKWFASQRDE